MYIYIFIDQYRYADICRYIEIQIYRYIDTHVYIHIYIYRYKSLFMPCLISTCQLNRRSWKLPPMEELRDLANLLNLGRG